MVAVLEVFTSTYPSDLNYIWRILPNYAFTEGINNLLQRQTLSESQLSLLTNSLFAWDVSTMNITYMLIESIVFFIITLLIEMYQQNPKLMSIISCFWGNMDTNVDDDNKTDIDIDVLNEQKHMTQYTYFGRNIISCQYF